MQAPRWTSFLGIVPSGFLALFFAWPLLVVAQAVLARMSDVDTDIDWSRYAQVVVWSSMQAGLSVLLTLAIGLPLAKLIGKNHFPGRRLLSALITAPFLLPTVVTGLTIRTLLPWFEPSLLLLVLGHAYINTAVVVRVVSPVWARLDERLEWQALALGASPVSVLRTVSLPLLAPAIRRAAAIVFIYTFGSLGLLLILGGETRTLESELLREVSLLLDFKSASAIALLQLLMVCSVLWWSRRGRVSQAGFLDVARPRKVRRAIAAYVWIAIWSVPILALLVRSFISSTADNKPIFTSSWWTTAFTDSRINVLPSISISLKNAVLAAVLVLALAVCLSIASLRGTKWLELAATSPMAVSAVTLGLGMLLAFGRPPLAWRDSGWLLPITHALLSLPIVAAFVLPQVRAVSTIQLSVAASLGATPLRALWDVYARTIRKISLQAAAIGAAVSLGEFGAASFLSDPSTPTHTVFIMRLLQRPGAENIGLAAVMSVLLAALSIALMSAVERMDERV